MTDFYLEYSAWFTRFYNRPFTVTREEWAEWCKAPKAKPQSDVEFDAEREREGDAQ